MLADISLRHHCMKRSLVCVVFMLVFVLQRPRDVMSFSDSDYLHAVKKTGLGRMLFSIIMSRQGVPVGCLLPFFCVSFVCLFCVCACLYMLRDACRSTVHAHFLRRLTALRHKASSPPFPVYSV